ncbi:AzlD family protein [Aquibaculum sediminis]|uniref:AzlD family protein n=1 Tax=Aquibaculum sediminis TaxID=3231907 RepID=UPI0034532D4C
MDVDSMALLAILGMALATYAVRASGFFLVQRLPRSRFLDGFLHHLPGAMFIALVTPPVLSGGPPTWAGALAVVGTAALKVPLLFSLLAGAGTVALLRYLL